MIALLSAVLFVATSPQQAAAGQQSEPIVGLEGVVRNTAGRPVAGATVRVRLSPVSAVTDATGHYRIREPLRPGALICAITADAESGEPLQVWSNRVKDLLLDKKATVLRGRVVGRDGEPVPGVTVVVRAKEKYLCTAFFNVAQVTTAIDGTYSCTLPFAESVGFVFLQKPSADKDLLIERTEQTYVFEDVLYRED